MVESSMIISTFKPFTPAPRHPCEIKDDKVIEDFTVFVCSAADVEEVVDEDYCCAGTGFRGWAAGVELSPGVGSGVEGVEIVGVGSSICFAAIDDDDVVSPEGGRVTAAFGWRRG